MSEDSKLKSLIAQRANIKGRGTIFKRSLDALTATESLTQVNINELEIKLNRFRELLKDFDNIQNKIEMVASDIEPQFLEREQNETLIINLIATAQNILDTFSKDKISPTPGSEGTDNHACNSVKLLTISLPKFNGDYLSWLEFRDTFDSLINQSNSISPINKYHYLRSSLEGNAAIVIKSLEFTAANYNSAWKLLCDRYNNSRILINNHVKSLFAFETINKESFRSIRYMIDYYTKNLRALQCLDEPTTSWDTLIIFIMSSKLDCTTSRHWEEHRNMLSSSPTLEDFLCYLRNRADVLETLQYGTTNNKRQTINNTFTNKNEKTKGINTFVSSNQLSKYTNKQIQCPVCNKEGHYVYACNTFKEMSIDDRQNIVSQLKLCSNCLHSGHPTFKCRRGPCLKCSKRHNTMLHHIHTQQNNNSNLPTHSSSTSAANISVDSTPVSLTTMSAPGQVLLCTAEVELVNLISKKSYPAKALLDCGSQSSFLTSKCLHIMDINKESLKTKIMSVCGINNAASQINKQCSIGVRSKINSFEVFVDCLIIPNITNKLPSVQVDYTNLNLSNNIQLADSTFYQPSEIDVLLGADVFWKIIKNKQIPLGENKPTLISSKFGWLIGGPTGNKFSAQVQCNFSQEIRESLARFWEIESIPNSIKLYSKDEEYCEIHFNETTKRLLDGRFLVKLPLRDNPETTLGDSLFIAKRRFFNLERKLANCDYKQDYINFINEYKQLGHLSEVDSPNFGYYIPHHAVIRDHSETTRLRVVFDASCRTTTNKSLNDLLLVGPTIQNDLLSIILRFRQYTYVVTGDIEKMYRQVLVDESQRHLQLILWRDDESQPLRTFQLNTVTYGTASAPYLSTRCLLDLANECSDDNLANTIRNDFYVDDWASGSETKEGLKEKVTGVVNQLSKGCFNLRKFRTNVPEIFNGLSVTSSLQDFSKESNLLGLKWLPTSDTLQFATEIDIPTNINKRKILSTSCKIFDPLGILSPCTIIPKLILQKLWLLKMGWDQPVSEYIRKLWCEFADNIKYLSDIEVNRHSLCSNAVEVEIHCFTDASQSGYATCIYLKSINNLGKVTVELLGAKQRVAPLKPEHTIPRLELLGAHLGARFCKKVVESLTIKLSRTIFWSDSQIVLSWLRTPPKTLKVFVANRINEIRELTDHNAWRYVPSDLNPADLATRGINPRQLKDNHLWWNGPYFLAMSEFEWPQQVKLNIANHVLPEIKTSLTIQCEQNLVSFHNYSQLTKLQRMFAYVLRFINNCKIQNSKFTGILTRTEMQNSLIILAKLSQSSFAKDIHSLNQYKKLNKKSALLALNPFLDEQGILRVGGRISGARHCLYEKIHPILIDSKHTFSKLLFEREHLRLLHCGPQQLLYSVREQFWPIRGKILAQSTVNKCHICRRLKAKALQPIMGNLPEPRVNPSPPFETCGTDFAGPFLISNRKGRGAKTSKCYLCIFVCFAVKAVHLEVVSELSTNAFILCLRRFISRRGKPKTIYCDNGKNFVGAKNELNRMLLSYNRTVSEFASGEGIDFKFSPAYSPSFGGIWEAGVKTAKFHLKRISGNVSLTFEELSTLFSQVEAIMNSRPLTPMSSDPSDLASLTPGHFLIGRPLSSIPTPSSERISVNRYQLVERLRQHFWQRWSSEYLSNLQSRRKWLHKERDIQVGDLVIIKDENLPPMNWLLGRVHQLFPGPDGVCRVTEILTTKGIIKRATTKLCPLFSEEQII